MRLDQLVNQMGDRVQLTWRSFLLRVEPKTDDRDQFIEYTKRWLNPAAQEPGTDFTVWASSDGQPASSLPAHVAHKAVSAIAPDRAMDFHHRLLRGYFTENRNIGDSDVLIELAADIGIDADQLAAAASDRRDEFTQLVIDEHNAAIQSEVTAVPTVVFENSFALPGAQPVETLVRMVERIEKKKTDAAND